MSLSDQNRALIERALPFDSLDWANETTRFDILSGTLNRLLDAARAEGAPAAEGARQLPANLEAVKARLKRLASIGGLGYEAHDTLREVIAQLDALSPPAAEGKEETGWLIEGWNAWTGEFKAHWWGLGAFFEEGFGWTTDSTKALRFAREIDAQEYIVEAGWTDAKPTEHAWGAGR